jgi:hypothetical protein
LVGARAPARIAHADQHLIALFIHDWSAVLKIAIDTVTIYIYIVGQVGRPSISVTMSGLGVLDLVLLSTPEEDDLRRDILRQRHHPAGSRSVRTTPAPVVSYFNDRDYINWSSRYYTT